MRPATVRRLLGLAAIVVMLAIMLVPTLRRYLEQRDQIATLEHSIVEQQRQVDDLMRERAKWDDQAFLEQQIRSRLHFVKPGETSYTVLDPQRGRRTSVDAQVVGVDLEAQQVPWYSKVWTSLSSADRLGLDPTVAPAEGGPTPTPQPTISDTPRPGSTPSGSAPGGRTSPGASPTR
ncbi:MULTISPECIES: FtsB family cell division protein [Arsenicicoccus]|uniref:FtsB family cell division protein n=1 Tax=Arsenicicoccus TaxID=267408 RepID=UPI002579B436|nr:MULTISPECIES: septum formation initiator family protein [Arsenicicoccus]